MISNLLKILTFSFLLLSNVVSAQEVWTEHFSVPEKGIWGDEDGQTVHSDFTGITTWTLSYANISLSNPNDYAKTVSTSGGRFECRDINGEVAWLSEEIDISVYKDVSIQLTASETGSGADEETKYLVAYYKLDGADEVLFNTNGENRGNWGSNLVEQKELVGQTLQLVVFINNPYSSDKVILDEVVILGKEELIPIEKGDILINEVMFNPFPGGNDFVEIYNFSEKEIPTNQLYLASRDKNNELTQIYSLSNKRFLFQAKSYLVLTKDTNGVFPWFTIECPECFLQMEKFPSFNNDEDFVVLLNENLNVIDELHYTEKMHSPLLADEEGISLERISFIENTSTTSNWHSASTESGYGTPGYKNSQITLANISGPKITFSPEAFSPNSDGYNDEYQIKYELDKPGYIANVTVFDAAGRYVLKLAQNEILGTSGEIIWNGEDETGQRQSLGVYVVVVEIFDIQGNSYRFKDGVVLTDVFD